MSEADQPKPDAPSDQRLPEIFRSRLFQVMLMLSLGLAGPLVTFPLRNFLLVLWIYGEAGEQQGIHVLLGKPLKFSDGHAVPVELDIVTGFGAIVLAIALGFTVAFLVTKFWEGLRKEMRQEIPGASPGRDDRK